MRIHGLQHVAFEGLGHIAKWIADQGHSLTMTRLYAGESLPDPADFDRLVIMGGPMNIYEDDRYPWLAKERRFIRQAIAVGKSAVGICLGAQLLADALGSKVYSGKHKEIGWLPIQVTEDGQQSSLCKGLPAAPLVFHWHGDTFDVPQGAVHLARSEGCNSQAFVYENRILGLQFHLESTPDTVAEILAHCSDELVERPYIQSEAQIRAANPALFATINHLLETLLSRLDHGASPVTGEKSV
ncbi:MAG: type 1 glutamine amidotransferase [Desulfobulbus sp.]|nr:type 1 glutamine amidotransferase [Desulfobulbus sp.]